MTKEFWETGKGSKDCDGYGNPPDWEEVWQKKIEAGKLFSTGIQQNHDETDIIENIEIGDIVRSYDFHRMLGCFVEGEVIAIGIDVPWCPCGGHIHIKPTLKVSLRSKRAMERIPRATDGYTKRFKVRTDKDIDEIFPAMNWCNLEIIKKKGAIN